MATVRPTGPEFGFPHLEARLRRAVTDLRGFAGGSRDDARSNQARRLADDMEHIADTIREGR